MRSLPPKQELREPHHHRQAAPTEWLDIDAARRALRPRRFRMGLGRNRNLRTSDLDVVLACAGDTATLETVAASMVASQACAGAPRSCRQRRRPPVDVLRRATHPHGMSDDRFVELFTGGHARPLLVSRLRVGDSPASSTRGHNPTRFPRARLQGGRGTTTTPFDMVVLNETSRYDIAIGRASGARGLLPERAGTCHRGVRRMLVRHRGLRRRTSRGHARDPRLDVGRKVGPGAARLR